jgi:hypothetical protein
MQRFTQSAALAAAHERDAVQLYTKVMRVAALADDYPVDDTNRLHACTKRPSGRVEPGA